MMIGTRRLQRIREERGSLPMAILVAMVGMSLAALMLPMLVMQISSTTFAATRGRALHAAQSGIEMGLAQIRAATKGADGDGDRSKLPCGPLHGPAADDGSNFDVRIEYFYADDPSLHDAVWQRDHVMICVNSAGPYDPASGSGTPSFALLTSTGTSPNETRDRTLQVTYIVKTTNRHIAGGAIPLFPEVGSTNHYCLDAGVPIAAGNAVGVKPCPTDPSRIPDQQKWAYGPDLAVKLTPTVGDVNLNPTGAGLCLDTKTDSHVVGSGIIVAPCATVGSGLNKGKAIWRQVWSINSNGHFEGSKTDYSDLDGFCLAASGQPSNQLTLDKSCSSSTTDPLRAWNPMPSVGAGQAGETNGQLVNFAQFGRCLDVTNQSVSAGSGGTFLILYPCKQNPNVTKLDWNQKWKAVPIGDGSTVQWRTYVGNSTSDAYCLTSPLQADKYVYVTTCTAVSSSATNQRWTTPAADDSAGIQLPYADKYLVKDASNPKGLCLDAGVDVYDGNSKVVVTNCSGGTEQKWNADPDVSSTNVVRLHEITGSSEK